METDENQSAAKKDGGDSQTTDEKNIPLEMRSETNEKLVLELTQMGFDEAAVRQIIDCAGDVPKDLIVEQLLTSNSESRPIPTVDDDGDQMWEDVSVNYKMVIVMNMDLNMGKGKIASQAAHAALGLYEKISKRPDLSSDIDIWNDQGSRKIVLEAKNTNELTKVSTAGKVHKIPLFNVHDAGLTEVAPDSFTALALFGSDDQLKPVTGKLRLLK